MLEDMSFWFPRKVDRVLHLIFSATLFLGGTPYPAISNLELLGALKSGYRMEKPQMCSDEM